jgi:hypothetical protein
LTLADEVSMSYSAGIFNMPQNLLHGDDGFTSPPKEVVLRIFIALKIYRIRSGLNPRTYGSLGITITTRPPRTTRNSVYCNMWNNVVRSTADILNVNKQ